MSKSQPVRILIVVMSLVLGLGALALAVPKMGSSALASASSGWVARPAHTIRITSTQTDRYGADVIGLKVLKTGRGSVWRKISPAGEIGSVFVATGAVSGRRNGQRATLVVRELVSGKAVQTRRATGRIHSGRTLHLSVAITRTRTGSRFALGLKVPKVYRGQRLLVSDAALRTSHGKPPKPSPTSSPTSSPTASHVEPDGEPDGEPDDERPDHESHDESHQQPHQQPDDGRPAEQRLQLLRPRPAVVRHLPRRGPRVEHRPGRPGGRVGRPAGYPAYVLDGEPGGVGGERRQVRPGPRPAAMDQLQVPLHVGRDGLGQGRRLGA